MTSTDKQRGVALLFVLLMFAIITSVAVRIVVQLHRNTEREAQFLQYQQAKHYAFGGEKYAAALLERKSSTQDATGDHWFQEWANDHQLSVNGGQIEIQMIDEQALLNLNSLHGRDGQQQLSTFERLFSILDINPVLAERIRRWGSTDPQILLEENNYYGTLESPIFVGGGPLSDVSELKTMQMLNDEEYKKLRPFITVLPEKAGINLNTVPQELLPAIFDGLTEDEAKDIVSLRGTAGFKDLNEIKRHPVLRNKNINWKRLPVTLSSQFFSAYIKATYHDATFYLHTVLARNEKGDIVVIRRDEGDYPQWVSILRRSVRDE